MKYAFFIVAFPLSMSSYSQTSDQEWPAGNWYYVFNNDTTYIQFSANTFEESYIAGAGQYRSRVSVSGSATQINKNTFLITYNPKPDFEGGYIRIHRYDKEKLTITRDGFKRGLGKRYLECIPME